MDDLILIQGYQLIKKDLPLEEDFDDGPIQSYDRLLHWLTLQVARLLNYDFQGLINALYRIDIPERDVKQILELEDPDKIASSLAEAILRRQLAKIETRRRYSGE